MSSETCGRLWDVVIYKSTSNCATALERMLEPRSACRLGVADSIARSAAVWAIDLFANAADSRGAIIRPTT